MRGDYATVMLSSIRMQRSVCAGLPDYVMFADQMYGACLWPALAGFFIETYFAADRQLVEAGAQYTIAMKVNHTPVRRFDAPEILARHEFDNAPMRYRLVGLHVPARAAGEILQPTSSGLERIAERDVDILV